MSSVRKKSREYESRVESERVPRRPRIGSSTMYPASNAPGIPDRLIMACCSAW
jgi:hypothetical protein